MKVKDLIEMLEDFDGDMEVVTTYDYGDIAHTRAVNFPENVSSGKIEDSGYSKSGYALSDDDEEDDGEDMKDKYVIIGNI